MAKSKGNFQQTPASDGQRYGLFGASGCGKTTKARELIRNTGRLIVFDSIKREWTTAGRSWLSGFCLVSSPEELLKAIRKRWTKGFQIVFCPAYGQEVRQLDSVCRIIWQVQAGFGLAHTAKITLFVDEAQECAPSGLARTFPAHGALLLSKMGRAKGINMIVASQRIKTVDIAIRSNLTGVYIFRLAELADINEANQIIMDKNALKTMANFDYFYKNETGQIKFFKKS